MLKKKSLIGEKPFFYRLNDEEGFDINTNLEFSYAEFLFNQVKDKL